MANSKAVVKPSTSTHILTRLVTLGHHFDYLVYAPLKGCDAKAIWEEGTSATVILIAGLLRDTIGPNKEQDTQDEQCDNGEKACA